MRSTLKCDILWLLNKGCFFMKTKIIYISGNEIFDMADIRAAFDEVRSALNLDKDTVLFGVPVDEDDAGLSASENIVDAQPDIVATAIVENTTDNDIEITEPSEDIVADKPKKRGRAKKTVVKEDIESEQISDEPQTENEEKIIPILSVLSVNEENTEDHEPESVEEDKEENPETEISITETLSDEETEQISENSDSDMTEADSSETDSESDLEQLLSAMKPLAEDIPDTTQINEEEIIDANADEENIDATLEQLATEFVKTQDRIPSENKGSSRSKIGKLRNILPFKQSKHKDQGLGDLFGWAGIAANDEDFSVPGFFTNASSRK